jgi:hypothetical protein
LAVVRYFEVFANEVWIVAQVFGSLPNDVLRLWMVEKNAFVFVLEERVLVQPLVNDALVSESFVILAFERNDFLVQTLLDANYSIFNL